jgi:two-component system, OmpR family, osmolarity sensor histidine kinase EnvZ
MNHQRPALSLFWRTFFLLLLLLGGSLTALALVLGLPQTGGRDAQAARDLAALVNLSRAALRGADRAERPALLRQLAQNDGIRLTPRSADDTYRSLPDDRSLRRVADTLRQRLGPGTVVAGQVNGVPAFWIGFSADRDAWWLGVAPSRVSPPLDTAWWVALAAVVLGGLLGSAVIAHVVNAPLRELSFAASRIRGGDMDSRLDESTITSEIREVNMGFNRMARELAKVDEDRAVMLAGISHDLRTPLARLRLEAEMSVADEEARSNIVSDINQLDAIIDKFMDYARPGDTHVKAVLLSNLIDKEAAAFRDPSEIRIQNKVAIDLKVMADEVELGRVLANLFENARRYGRGTDTGRTLVEVSYVRIGTWVICSVRDHGPGFAADKLSQLTTPFYRGDAARTAATGAGLGLAIVEKAMARMKGTVELANAPDGGLIVHLRLRHAR